MDDDHHEIEALPYSIYFICPLSLQIMKDPVTTITGITYDRDSIEQWLFFSKTTIATCPVTKMPLPRDSDLTPNHTLRRLIQSCYGIDRIPTPKPPPLNKDHVLKLLKDLNNKDPNLKVKSLRQLQLLAAEPAEETNRKCFLEAGVPKAMIFFILGCYKKGVIEKGIEEALSLLQFVKIPSEEVKVILSENDQVLDSLTWVLGCEDLENSVAVKSHIVMVIKTLIQKGDHGVLERLKPEFFEGIVKVLRNGVLTQQGVSAVLEVLLNACSLRRNRGMMVEFNVVFELIEIEMMSPSKRITELNVTILSYLCSCPSGRAQFLCHNGAIGLLTKRLLRVSVAVDDRVMFVFSLICTYSAKHPVLQEMLKVGIIPKLCLLLQTNCDKRSKDKAREIIRTLS